MSLYTQLKAHARRMDAMPTQAVRQQIKSAMLADAIKVSELATEIDDFDAQCDESQHTDTGGAWDLLHRIRAALK